MNDKKKIDTEITNVFGTDATGRRAHQKFGSSQQLEVLKEESKENISRVSDSDIVSGDSHPMGTPSDFKAS